jgi:hypothetical protein
VHGLIYRSRSLISRSLGNSTNLLYNHSLCGKGDNLETGPKRAAYVIIMQKRKEVSHLNNALSNLFGRGEYTNRTGSTYLISVFLTDLIGGGSFSSLCDGYAR